MARQQKSLSGLVFLSSATCVMGSSSPLRWRHNGFDSVSNHQPHDCLLNRLFRRRSKKTSKFRVTGLWRGIHRGPVNSPHKWSVTRKMFPFDDVITTAVFAFSNFSTKLHVELDVNRKGLFFRCIIEYLAMFYKDSNIFLMMRYAPCNVPLQLNEQFWEFRNDKILADFEVKIPLRQQMITVCSSLDHWGRVTHICVSKLTSIGSDNGLSPGRCQTIISPNAGILLIGSLEINFSEMLIEILTFLFKKMRLKVSSEQWRPCCLGFNVSMC